MAPAEPPPASGTTPPDATVEGPPLASLMQRLALTPPDVLDPGVSAVALIGDAIDLLALTVPGPWQLDAASRRTMDALWSAGPPPARAAAGIVCWLVRSHDVRHLPGLPGAAPHGPASWLLMIVHELAETLAPVRPPTEWVATPEGREEAARAFLRAGRLRPAGENDAVAADRWSAVSTVEQQRIIREMAQEARHAEELAKALAEKRAQEAAAQYTNY